MAVQAQYPSNVLLQNSRAKQEEHDYSLQKTGAPLLNPSPMLYNNNNNGNNNSRKRREREEAVVGHAITTTSTVINPLFLQSQPPPQLINLSQLHNHNHNAVSTGLRLSLADQHQQRQLHQSQPQASPSPSPSPSTAFLSLLSQHGLASLIKQQRDELDQLLQAQGEQLRRALAEKRQRDYRALLGAAEEAVARRLREKDAEVEKAMRKNTELEARAAQLSVEAQAWMARARTQELAAASLQAQLQQTMMCHGGEDTAAVACALENHAEDAESAHMDPERVPRTPARRNCRGCGFNVASVLVLPCRHLCICTECVPHFTSCPLCLTPNNSTIQVSFS